VRTGAGDQSTGGRGGSKAPPNLSDPPKLAVVPVTCRSFRLPGLARSPPKLQRAPQFSISRILPMADWPPATSGVASHRSPGRPQTCLSAPRSASLGVPELHASCFPPALGWAAGLLGPAPGEESSPARPRGVERGGGQCRRLCGKARGDRSPPAPRRPPPRVGTPDFPAARLFGGPRGPEWAFAASAAKPEPCGPAGAPRVAGRLP
jgi:hypothetical protein